MLNAVAPEVNKNKELPLPQQQPATYIIFKHDQMRQESGKGRSLHFYTAGVDVIMLSDGLTFKVFHIDKIKRLIVTITSIFGTRLNRRRTLLHPMS